MTEIERLTYELKDEKKRSRLISEMILELSQEIKTLTTEVKTLRISIENLNIDYESITCKKCYMISRRTTNKHYCFHCGEKHDSEVKG